jgi:hypothetical protein
MDRSDGAAWRPAWTVSPYDVLDAKLMFGNEQGRSELPLNVSHVHD